MDRPKGKLKMYIDFCDFETADVKITLYIVDERSNKIYMAKPLEFVQKEEGCEFVPTYRIGWDGTSPRYFLEDLAKELHKNGFMQKEIELKENELKATKYHLEDMRKLIKLK